MRSLSNEDSDDDGDDNGQKPIDLISKTTTLHAHHAFLYISLPSLHDYDAKMPNLMFTGGREQTTTVTFFFFSYTLTQSFRIQLQKKMPTFDELSKME